MGVTPLSTVTQSFCFLGTIILKHNKSHYQSDTQLHVLRCLDNLKSLKDALMISSTQYFKTFSNYKKFKKKTLMPKKYKGRNLSVFIDVQLYSQHSTTAIMAGLSNH